MKPKLDIRREAADSRDARTLLAELDAELAQRYQARMFVRPDFRGQGIALMILEALEQEARNAGYDRLLLETGTRQPEALALYRRAGYVEREPYGEYVGNPFSVCMMKTQLSSGEVVP